MMHKFLSVFIGLACSLSVSATTLKISMIPFQILGGLNYSQLEVKVEKTIEQAAKSKPDLIVLPELISFELLEINPGDDVTETLKKHTNYFENYVKLTQKLARQHKTNIVSGSFQRMVDGEILNTAIFSNKNGEITLQDKLFLTPWEGKQGWSNGKKLHFIDVNGVKAVILICHDSEFPLISQAISKATPELIIVPSMTDDLYGYNRVNRTSMARAVEHMAYVLQLGTTSAAKAPWHTYYGNAAFLTPQNSAFKGLEKNSPVGIDQAFEFSLDINLLREQRKKSSHVYPARDQNARADSIIVGKLIESAQ